jgi:hypothetical protein
MSQFKRPVNTALPSVSFKIGCRWHDSDTFDGVPIEATKRLEISTQQMGRTHTDCRPQNWTIVFGKLRQDGTLSLWRQHRYHFDRFAQPFQLCPLLPRSKIPLGLLQCMRRCHQHHFRQCEQLPKRRVQAVRSREQDVGVKKDLVHGLGADRLVVGDLSGVEAHLPHFLFRPRIVLSADRI